MTNNQPDRHDVTLRQLLRKLSEAPGLRTDYFHLESLEIMIADVVKTRIRLELHDDKIKAIVLNPNQASKEFFKEKP